MQSQFHQAVSSNLTSSYTDLQRISSTTATSTCKAEAGSLMNESGMKSITMENAVVVVSRKGCCMSYVVTRLLSSLGVNPRVVEVEMGAQLVEDECNTPAVFIGGRLLGGVDRLLAAHITGNLVPQLKAAGALWL